MGKNAYIYGTELNSSQDGLLPFCQRKYAVTGKDIPDPNSTIK